MKRLLIALLVCLSFIPAARAQAAITPAQHGEIMNALLKYLGHEMHFHAQMMTVAYIPLAIKEEGEALFVWAIYKNRSYRLQNGAVHPLNTGTGPARIQLKQRADGAYETVDVLFPREGEYFGKDVRALFPEEIRDQAMAYHRAVGLEKPLGAQAAAYFEGEAIQGENAWWLEALPPGNGYHAHILVRSAFAHYPCYEGELVWGFENQERCRYSLKVAGELSYAGTLTFEKHTLDGRLLHRAVVQVEDGALKVLEGSLPQTSGGQ